MEFRETQDCGDAIMMANSRDVDVSCFHGIGGGAMIVVQSEKIRDTIALRFQPVRASDFFSLSLSLSSTTRHAIPQHHESHLEALRDNLRPLLKV